MNTRLATPSDSAVLSRLSVDVQSLHADHHPNIFKKPENDDFARSFFDEMLADPSVSIFIAEDDGDPVGCMVCKLVERPENSFTFAARILHIDQISVRPFAQGRGVGAALIHQAEILAKDLKVQRMSLDSWEFNLNAHAFFEHQGFQKFMFRFWKHL